MQSVVNKLANTVILIEFCTTSSKTTNTASFNEIKRVQIQTNILIKRARYAPERLVLF